MKRISFLLVTVALCATPGLRAQDAAMEERLNKLNGQIENVMETQQELSKRISNLAKEIENLREQMNKPTGNYAGQEDLKRVAKAVEDVDRKRVADAEKIHNELLDLRKTLLAAGPASSGKRGKTSSAERIETDKPEKPEKGFEYLVKSGDTLSIIAQAYREQNIKVTVDQILKANPGLKADRLVPGKKIFIPASK